ncbi:MAG TPA: PIN domain-containing protein [Candidatus Nanoarchaeia archaeon]|nr:PIN domain-containing protein [Candidatus Nanoarchaeia archaeon]
MAKVYADTDFFLALLKNDDWLKSAASKIYQKYKGNICTSSATFLELFLVAKRLGMDIKQIAVTALEFAELTNGDANSVLLAAHYIQEKNVNVFDAFHAAYAYDLSIVSSDHIFDRIGMRRIALENFKK